MRASMILKMLLTAAMSPMFAADEDTASAASTTEGAEADASAGELPTTGPTPEADTTVASNTQAASSDAPADADPTAASTAASQVTAPVVQTQPPVAQPGNSADSVLETVKTPAHNVAEEIEAEIKKLEQLPPEVAAWFKSKFVELSAHIKALL